MKIPKLSILACVLALTISLPGMVLSQSQLDNDVVDAVNQGDVPTLAMWVANGGDVNLLGNNDNTLLMMGAKVGDLQTLEYLVQQGADVNAQNRVGSTALMIAAKYGHSPVVALLLEKGADPAVRNNYGITAARFALANDHGEVYYQLQEAALVTRSNS